MESYPKVFELYTPEGKGIIGELTELGILTFAIEAGEGSSIRGTEMFNRMMQVFGNEVRAIHAVWRKYSEAVSTNIDKVNELTAAGMPIADAISHAWTVTRAAKLGFLKAILLETPEGQPGAYSKIDVLIER
jgi:hypothetical protein